MLCLDGHHIFKNDFLDITYYGQARRLQVLHVSGSKNNYSATNRQDKICGIVDMDNSTYNDSNCNKKVVCDQDSGQELSQQLQSLSLTAVSVLDGKDQKTSNVDNGEHCKQSSSMGLDSLTGQSNITDESTKPCEDNRLYYYVSSDETCLTIVPHGTTRGPDKVSRSKLNFSSIGGLGAQIQAVREMVEMPLKHPELFSAYGEYLHGHEMTSSCKVSQSARRYKTYKRKERAPSSSHNADFSVPMKKPTIT